MVERVKDLEARGYTFEAADASFELLLRDELAGERLRHFQVESWRVIVERRADGAVVSEATVKLHAKGERIVATGEGNGPVNALDNALRLALERLYPELAMLELADYKVRILEGSHGTGAVTRVLIESGDGTGAADGTWSTVGVDENIIAASWHALEEAVTYALLRAGYQPDPDDAPRRLSPGELAALTLSSAETGLYPAAISFSTEADTGVSLAGLALCVTGFAFVLDRPVVSEPVVCEPVLSGTEPGRPGRITISLTSTPAGWLTAYSTARATSPGSSLGSASRPGLTGPVSVSPGWIRVTRTPVPTHSARMLAASALTAHLVAEYRLPGTSTRPATEPVSSRCPRVSASMGSTARAVSAVPSTLVWTMPAHSSGGRPPWPRNDVPTALAALASAASSRPSVRPMVATRSWTWDQSEMSQLTGMARGGPPSSAASSASGPPRRAVSTTR